MFEARRKRFIEAMGPGAVALVPGAGRARRSNDTEFRFRQDSDFHYLTGFDHPDALAVLRSDGGPGFTLFVEPRDPEQEIWTGYRPGVEGALEDFGADCAHARSELDAQLPELFAHAERFFHIPGRDSRFDARLFALLEAQRLNARRGSLPPEAMVDPRGILHEMRLRKAPAELEIMRRAAAITCEAHAEAARLAHGGRMEYELEAALDYTFRRRGAWGAAYNSIVAGGANATILHYTTNDQPLRDGELLLIDAGCELEGYASDVTRTYPVGGAFTAGQRAFYEVVLEAQSAAIKTCKPGATLQDIHHAALFVLAQGMLDLKLLTGNVVDVVESGAYKRYYMHGTSHWIGLDVHDAGAYQVNAKSRALEPGMVFSVEPGLYVARDDERAPEALRGVGVRIEDDVVITEAGCENLNAEIPRQPDEIEAWVQGFAKDEARA